LTANLVDVKAADPEMPATVRELLELGQLSKRQVHASSHARASSK
jgi:hypothetical protein